jgi:transposase
VEELAREGGDSEAIARRYKVRGRTLVWWRAELARRAREAAPRGPRLLPVVLDPHAGPFPSAAPAIEVVVEVGAARVSVRGAVSVEHLVAILGRLGARC